MLGFGKVNPGREGNLTDAVQKGLYSCMVDDNTNYVQRSDVRFVGVSGNDKGCLFRQTQWITGYARHQ